jgi:DNA polymerase-1
MKNRELLIIIDGSALIYRAFYAIPDSFVTKSGLPTNAVYGFTQSVRKILKDYSPEYIAVAFDVKGPTHRHEIFDDYKAERPPMPDLLGEQIPHIKAVTKAYSIPVLEKTGYEADDIIAAVARRAGKAGLKVAIITGDKDMYQLVDADTVILDYNSGTEYGEAEVEEKFGVPPSSIRDLLALAGDSSDNIPGVPGVGPKTAVKLLKEYGSIDAIYEGIDGVGAAKLKARLIEHKKSAYLSRKLATLHEDVDFGRDIESLKSVEPDYKELAALFKSFEFAKLLKEAMADGGLGSGGPARTEYTRIETQEALSALLERAKKGQGGPVVALHLESGRGAFTALSMALSAGEVFTLDISPDNELFIDTEGFLRALLEDESVELVSDDAKPIHLYSFKRSINARSIHDTSIASYLLDPSGSKHTVEALAFEHLDINPEDGEDLSDADRMANNASNILQLWKILHKKLEDGGLSPLYTEMELPLVRVLARMESHGIRVEAGILKELSAEIKLKLSGIEASIYGLAGGEFNINSPKQLAEVLFVKLGLKPIKKTKTGFSTNEEVLLRLASAHELPAHVLEYRSLAKLKSTYVDGLLKLIGPDHRVHTSFNQTVTATGRLSSSKPNLQNIPVRSGMSARIRGAFGAEKGFSLLSADYSQIELRIVAHMAEDPALIEAFAKDVDVHAQTASQVFGVAPEAVTPELRRRAKAINFGIIYGMGAWGLSTELGISVGEADAYIESYFAHYKAVKSFIDKTIKEAKGSGYTTTLFGRRRFIYELKSPSEAVVRFGERQAVNTPIQGTAADIIKAAMIKIDAALSSWKFRSRMLLQIHDELLFEVADDEADAVSELVTREMEGVIKLKVPVKVNLKSGTNWSALTPQRGV